MGGTGAVMEWLTSLPASNSSAGYASRRNAPTGLPPYLKEHLKRIQLQLKVYRDSLTLVGDPATVRLYYRAIMLLTEERANPGQVSLAECLGPLFRLGLGRALETDSVEENRALILALAMYFGTLRFEPLIGPVRTEEMKLHAPRSKGVVLRGREDLRLHFIISAGLKLLSDSHASHETGEFKELLDVGSKGGSFSFADLAADRAGVRFAEVATDQGGGAWRLQWELSKRSQDVTEAMFFPDVSDLPEGLSEEEFEARFGGLDNFAYQTVVKEIDNRLDQLVLYRGSYGRR